MTRRSNAITPPGAVIREQLIARGMKQKEFAARMDMSQKHISRLINGEVQLTPECAVRLELVLGTPAKYWSHLEAVYREKLVKLEAEQSMDSDIEIAYKMPYGEMASFGWVPAKRNAKDRVQVLRKYFEVVQLSLLENHQITKIACKNLSLTKTSDLAFMAWAQEVKLVAREIQTEPMNISKLLECLGDIRELMTMPIKEAIPHITEQLATCGIALVFLPNFKDVFFQGATFIDGNKIVLGLPEQEYDLEDFWFSIFHEFGHIVLGHINASEGLTAQDEKEADRWAREHYE